MRILVGGLCAVVLAAVIPVQTLNAAGSCAELSMLALPNTTITLAQDVRGRPFTPPGGARRRRGRRALPAFCRVAATLTPSSDSDIKIEVWLPAANWNGKFQAVGNGAFNGTIAYPAMTTALARGYATTSTDTGHVGGSASFALGHPEKVIDFGYRAVHEMTVAAKAIIAATTAPPRSFSYWNGCSAGGRQATEGSAALPRRLRRHHRRRARARLDRPRVAGGCASRRRCRRDEAARLPSSDSSAPASRRAGGVRRDRRRQGRRRSRIRSAAGSIPASLQCKGPKSAGVPDAGAGRTARLIYSPSVNPKTKREIAGLSAGQRARMDRSGLDRVGARDRTRPVPVPRVQGSRRGTSSSSTSTPTSRARRRPTTDTINALDPNLKPRSSIAAAS